MYTTAAATQFTAPLTRVFLIALAALLMATFIAPSAQAKPLSKSAADFEDIEDIDDIDDIDDSNPYSLEEPTHRLICVCQCSDGNWDEPQTFDRPFGADCSDIDNDSCTQDDGDSGSLHSCTETTAPNTDE